MDPEIPLRARFGRDKPDPPVFRSIHAFTEDFDPFPNRLGHCAIGYAVDLQFDVHGVGGRRPLVTFIC